MAIEMAIASLATQHRRSRRRGAGRAGRQLRGRSISARRIGIEYRRQDAATNVIAVASA